MKKYLSILLAVVVLLYAFAFSASAQSAVTEATVTQQDGSVIYYHDNGTYTVVSVVEAVVAGARSEAKTKTATATASNYEGSDNSLNWTYELTATFSYTEGESATCTTASYSQTVSNGWQFSDGSATKSGNTAYGTGTFVKKWLFIIRDKLSVNLYVSCDSYGNITKGSNG